MMRDEKKKPSVEDRSKGEQELPPSSRTTSVSSEQEEQDGGDMSDGNGTSSSDSHDEYTDHFSTVGLQSPQDIQRNLESNVPVRYRKLPAKLDSMLSTSEFEPYITWMPHGRSWKIHNADGFATFVLPKYFDNQSFSSFIRLVNAWGFRRKVKPGVDRNSYYHEFFLRGRPDLHDRMSRLATSKKKPMGTEPDLFKFPSLPAPNTNITAAASRTAEHPRIQQESALHNPLGTSSTAANSDRIINPAVQNNNSVMLNSLAAWGHLLPLRPQMNQDLLAFAGGPFTANNSTPYPQQHRNQDNNPAFDLSTRVLGLGNNDVAGSFLAIQQLQALLHREKELLALQQNTNLAGFMSADSNSQNNAPNSSCRQPNPNTHQAQQEGFIGATSTSPHAPSISNATLMQSFIEQAARQLASLPAHRHQPATPALEALLGASFPHGYLENNNQEGSAPRLYLSSSAAQMNAVVEERSLSGMEYFLRGGQVIPMPSRGLSTISHYSVAPTISSPGSSTTVASTNVALEHSNSQEDIGSSSAQSSSSGEAGQVATSLQISQKDTDDGKVSSKRAPNTKQKRPG